MSAAHDLLQQLPAIADRLHAQMHELLRCPTPERAERLAIELDGSRLHVMQTRRMMQSEAEGPDR
jgi:hypothetical protein